MPANLTLLPLPPYAPELNPVENVWAYLRANQLSNTVWEAHEQIVEACCRARNALLHQPSRITSISQLLWTQVKL